MRSARRGRTSAVTAGLLGLTLAVSACGTGGESGGGGGEAQGGGQQPEGCEDLAQYGSQNGQAINIYSSIREEEADRYLAAFA